MRVFFVSARGDSFGGASLHIRDMARRLMDDGHAVRIAVGGTAGMEVPRRFAEQGLDFVCIPVMGRKINPLDDARAVWRLRREVREFSPDLVSTHASKGGALGRLACVGLGVPAIYTPHCWSFVEGFPNARVYRAAEKILAPFTSRIVAVCEDERSFGLRMGVGTAAQTQCIHNGVIDQPEAGGLQQGAGGRAVRLLMVGRFEQQKDQPLLLRALAELKHLDWVLTLVGDGPLKGDCIELACRLGIADRVDFAGYSSAVENHLADADVFALISNWEGFPRSVLEAMRSRLPVIVSDVGGSSEAVIDGETGRVVARGSAAELKGALSELICDAAARTRMGSAGRAHFEERFTFEQMYRQYWDLYCSLASRPAAAPISDPHLET